MLVSKEKEESQPTLTIVESEDQITESTSQDSITILILPSEETIIGSEIGLTSLEPELEVRKIWLKFENTYLFRN